MTVRNMRTERRSFIHITFLQLLCSEFEMYVVISKTYTTHGVNISSPELLILETFDAGKPLISCVKMKYTGDDSSTSGILNFAQVQVPGKYGKTRA